MVHNSRNGNELTLKELEVFSQVANNSNLTLLSKSLEMTQPNISLTIRSLEKKLKETLFDRISKKLILNERGRLLQQKIVPILDELKETRNIFLKNKIAGKINIGSTNTLAIYFLPYLLYNYKKLHNEVYIKHYSANTKELIAMINSGRIDIGFIESEVSGPDIVREFLKKDELIIVSSDKTLIGNKYLINDLFYKNWILREEESGVVEIFFDYLGELKNNLNIILKLQHTLAIKHLLVKYPETISCLPLKSVQEELLTKQLYRVDVQNLNFSRNYYLIYHKNKSNNIVYESFKYFILENKLINFESND